MQGRLKFTLVFVILRRFVVVGEIVTGKLLQLQIGLLIMK